MTTGQPSGWLRDALHPSVVRRAILYSIIVGIILITINHGDALLSGEVTGACLVKMTLTAAVPYIVSTLSSVGAIRTRTTVNETAPS